jgi:hypothetical protein
MRMQSVSASWTILCLVFAEPAAPLVADAAQLNIWIKFVAFQPVPVSGGLQEWFLRDTACTACAARAELCMLVLQASALPAGCSRTAPESLQGLALPHKPCCAMAMVG